MEQQDIAGDMARAREYLRTLPAMARFHDTPARATMDHDLVVRVAGPDGLPDGMLAGLGPGASVPSPGWYFRASLAASVAMFITMRAAEKHLILDGLVVTVDAESDDRGALGMEEGIPSGPLEMRVTVHYDGSDGDESAARAVIEWALEHCTVYDAIIRSVPVELSIERGVPEAAPAAESSPVQAASSHSG
ncbi:OsmC family protein [Naasia aerilata]|uniref:OsmC-like protein n=1 Tax=Naasia aerilata TaxID=1162966 RepID=A0ABM8G914_9MICO|nr:OsmC family protein [Naasia aerilata]BDZ44662.1 hypothetical protein GCM10025866_05710 [Naasia aerilata]